MGCALIGADICLGLFVLWLIPEGDKSSLFESILTALNPLESIFPLS